MLYYVHTNEIKNLVSAFKSIKSKYHIWNILPVPMTITSYLDGRSSSMIKTVAGFQLDNNSQYPTSRRNGKSN